MRCCAQPWNGNSIIGEALRLAIRDDVTLAGVITHSTRIVAFRNRLVHGYANVLSDVVWGVLETDLPTLRAEVSMLLKDAYEESQD